MSTDHSSQQLTTHILSIFKYSFMSKRKLEISRLGKWYDQTVNKRMKESAEDKITKIIAPRNSVTGSQKRDEIMNKVTKKMAKNKLGGAYIKEGGDIGRLPKDKVHNKKHPGFKKVAQKIARKEHIPIERANAILAASTRRHLEGGSMINKLPQMDFIPKSRASGQTREVPDLKLDRQLAKAGQMMSGGAPLDKDNEKAEVSDKKARQEQVLRDFAPRLKNKKRLTALRRPHNFGRHKKEGGRTFTSMKNIYVTPAAAP
jgi:hypothetical protein